MTMTKDQAANVEDFSFSSTLLPNKPPYEVTIKGKTANGEVSVRYNVNKEVAVRIINICVSEEEEQLKIFGQDGENYKVPETTL